MMWPFIPPEPSQGILKIVPITRWLIEQNLSKARFLILQRENKLALFLHRIIHATYRTPIHSNKPTFN